MFKAIGLFCKAVLMLALMATAVWLYLTERITEFWCLMLVIFLLALVIAAQLRRLNERGTLKNPDAVFQSPPGCHYCWGSQVKENGSRKLEHYLVSVKYSVPVGFDLTLKTQWDKPRDVIDAYPPDVAGFFFKRHLDLTAKPLREAGNVTWQPQLRREILTEICDLLGEIPNSMGGRLTAHSNRLVFRWSRLLTRAVPAAKIDEELRHATTQMEHLAEALTAKQAFFVEEVASEVAEPEPQPQIVVQQWQTVR